MEEKKLKIGENFISRTLEYVSGRVTIPKNAGVILEGSIAEGFGNSGSDIDFLIVTEDEENRPIMPSILWYEGRRIEIRYRSFNSLIEQTKSISSINRKSKNISRRINEDTLDKHYRFLNGIILKNAKLVEEIRSLTDYGFFEKTVLLWYQSRAIERIIYADILLEYGHSLLSISWSRSSLIEGAKYWVGKKRELYIVKKWIYQQFERAKADKNMVKEFSDLYSYSDTKVCASEYIKRCKKMLLSYGIDKKKIENKNVFLKRRKNVVTFQLGEKVHVIKNKEEVYSLNKDAGLVWRNLIYEVPIKESACYIGVNVALVGEAVILFHKLGLLDFSIGEKNVIKVGNDFSIPSSCETPLISLNGINLKKLNKEKVVLSPISASRFAYLGITLVWENMEFENTMEDYIGAVENQEWKFCDHRLREIIQHICFILMCSYGVAPLPPLVDVYDDAFSFLVYIFGRKNEITKQLMKLNTCRIESEENASECINKIKSIIRTVRRYINADVFPDCFSSEKKWQDALDIGYDWVRLGAYVDSNFPIEEARDLLSTGGKQPHIKDA